ncbi:hypothetical protein [Haloarcula amylolytica]|uniref:Uncharacterized protein n=1 Tax=Haloarcula amylolytica JCM 13557 TaxID=1227452 RepID=M0KCZ1_9EURY|nr:hypothetical protein [Haloarcula amylolytica]EMA19061.1 hypothetical protein C442_14068 [Haloarcula amylolytica JCM 13557]
MTCRTDECDAPIFDAKRIASVDGEYGPYMAVGRHAGVCASGHLSVWDVAEA